jgi:hypothetical protein
VKKMTAGDEVNFREILERVLTENERQFEKFGPQFDVSPSEWLAILGEEFGEVARALCEGDTENYKEELIQVAAVAVNALACYEREERERRNPIGRFPRQLRLLHDDLHKSTKSDEKGFKYVPRFSDFWKHL